LAPHGLKFIAQIQIVTRPSADPYAARHVDNFFFDGVEQLAVVKVEFLVGPALT
jgi:hypothetical protein